MPATTTPSALRSRMHSITSVPASSATSRAWSPPVMKIPVAFLQQRERRLGVRVLALLNPQPVGLRRSQLPEELGVAFSAPLGIVGGGGDDGDASLLAAGQRDEALQDLAAGALVLRSPNRHHRTLADLPRRRRGHGG